MTYPAVYGPVYTGGIAPVSTPAPGWPLIIVEAGFAPTAPGLAGTELILDDPVFGLLDTGTLASGTVWTSLNGYMPAGEAIVQTVTITRSSTRQQGPLVTYEAGTCTITLSNSDARFSPENLAGPYVSAGQTQVRPMVPIRVRATWAGNNYNLFSGFALSWTPPTATYGPDYDVTVLEATDAFRVLAGVTLPEIAPAGAGELSGTRIGRILGAAGWYAGAQGGTDIDAGQSTMQATVFGATALSLLQLTADSEVADLYVDGAGRVVFRDRHAPFTDTRSSTVQAVFGDTAGTVHPAGTELPYVEITRPDDDVTMCNDVQATIDGGTNLQQATDATAVSRFLFRRSYPRSDLILQTDLDALQWANYVLTISKNDESRFDALTLQADDPSWALFPQALGRELGDRIQVWRDPPGMAAFSKDCFIRGITHTITVDGWETVWGLQAATRYAFLALDNAVTGQLNFNQLGW